MIVNIYKTTIDMGKVLEAVLSAENSNYVIMNNKTFHSFKTETEQRLRFFTDSKPFFNEVYGVPIAICEKLSDGEIEVV